MTQWGEEGEICPEMEITDARSNEFLHDRRLVFPTRRATTQEHASGFGFHTTKESRTQSSTFSWILQMQHHDVMFLCRMP